MNIIVQCKDTISDNYRNLYSIPDALMEVSFRSWIDPSVRESKDSCDTPYAIFCSRSLFFTGVLVAEMASFISSNFLTTVVAADFKLFRPPSIISFDFFPVKLDGLK